MFSIRCSCLCLRMFPVPSPWGLLFAGMFLCACPFRCVVCPCLLLLLLLRLGLRMSMRLLGLCARLRLCMRLLLLRVPVRHIVRNIHSSEP